MHCYGLSCTLQNAGVEDLTLNVTVFCDKIFREDIKVKEGYKGRVLIQWEEGKREVSLPTTGGHSKKAAQ